MIDNAVLNDKNLEEYFLLTDDLELIKYNKKDNSYKELKKIENINSKEEVTVLKLMYLIYV
ncbi:hypothetical protein [Brachyspira hampsonii]|uniref:hypothetical protein n=1 Tax=Brachyspira hampsonii TaxID=1287055 RepID=UPI0002EBC761|nr:hypothetical protein [Brachyspira hampsonii]